MTTLLEKRVATVERTLQQQGKSLTGRSINAMKYTELGYKRASDINRAIQDSNPGDIIQITGDEWIADQSLRLLPYRTYISSWGTVIKQADNLNLSHLMQMDDETQKSNFVSVIGLRFDGNKANGNPNTIGAHMFALYQSSFEDIFIAQTGGTGFYLDGNTGAGLNTSQTHLRNIWTYGCGGYGTYLSPSCNDCHVYGGDNGYNGYAGLYLAGPSCSASRVISWGTQAGSGVIIGSQAPSCQLFDITSEGHAGHGVEVKASHVFVSGKIYDNANISANNGLYDGVYVNGTVDSPAENVVIDASTIYSGLYNGNGYHRAAVNLGPYHKNCEVKGIAGRYLGNGVVDGSRPIILGIQDGDVVGDVRYITSTTRPNNPIDGATYYELDTGRRTAFITGYGWGHFFQKGKTLSANSAVVAVGLTYIDITFGLPKPDTNYSIKACPSWNTTFWFTNKTVAGFRINFGTASPGGGVVCDWDAVSY